MKTINIKVSNKIAEKYSRLSDKDKESVSKEFSRVIENNRSILDVMRDMSIQAKKNGLTPEILEELLKDE